MHVIFVSSEFPPGPGGIGDHAVNLVEQLGRSGFEVSVLTEWRKEFSQEERAARIPGISYISGISALRFLKFLLGYLRLLAINPSAPVIASGSKSLILVGLINFFSARKRAAILHGHETRMGNSIYRFMVRTGLKNFNLVIGVSEFSTKSASFLPSDKVIVIPNGINTARWSHEFKERSPKFSTLNLLTLGRISRRKGQHHVVSALPAIMQNHPDVQYHMVGLDAERDSIFLQARQLGVEGKIIIHGLLPDNQVKELLKSTDVFLMLSENQQDGDVEGFGIAIIEANYFGIPAIGSRGCGIEQAIKDGITGYLVNSGDSKEVGDAVDKIFDNYKEFQRQAREWAENHSWEMVGREYVKAFSKLFYLPPPVRRPI
jgi:phosphatidyl-myo-inositol dimannoside synthase